MTSVTLPVLITSPVQPGNEAGASSVCTWASLGLGHPRHGWHREPVWQGRHVAGQRGKASRGGACLRRDRLSRIAKLAAQRLFGGVGLAGHGPQGHDVPIIEEAAFLAGRFSGRNDACVGGGR